MLVSILSFTQKLAHYFGFRTTGNANRSWPDGYNPAFTTAYKICTSTDTLAQARTGWGTKGPVIDKQLVDHCRDKGLLFLVITYEFADGRVLEGHFKISSLLKWKSDWIAKGGGNTGYYIPWGYWARHPKKQP